MPLSGWQFRDASASVGDPSAVPLAERVGTELLDHLVTIGAVYAEHTIEVLTVYMHYSHQHVCRRDSSGASLTCDANGVLGHLCNRLLMINARPIGLSAVELLVELLQWPLAHAERPQRHPNLAVQAQDPQPALSRIL